MLFALLVIDYEYEKNKGWKETIHQKTTNKIKI